MTGSGKASGQRPAAYEERLWPTAGVWLAGLLLGGSAGLVLLPFGQALGVAGAAAGAAAVTALLVWSTPRVAVEDGTFVAGRARLPLTAAGVAEVLDADQMRRARGVQADARAYLCQRGWLPAGVRVAVDDPADPVPYWLVSSRNPDRLAAALVRPD